MTEVPALKLFCRILKNLLERTWTTLILYGSNAKNNTFPLCQL